MSRSRLVVEEVDGRLQTEYESRLRDALQEMREENEQQLRQMREDTEGLFQRKVNYTLGHIFMPWYAAECCSGLDLLPVLQILKIIRSDFFCFPYQIPSNTNSEVFIHSAWLHECGACDCFFHWHRLISRTCCIH